MMRFENKMKTNEKKKQMMINGRSQPSCFLEKCFLSFFQSALWLGPPVYHQQNYGCGLWVKGGRVEGWPGPRGLVGSPGDLPPIAKVVANCKLTTTYGIKCKKKLYSFLYTELVVAVHVFVYKFVLLSGE